MNNGEITMNDLFDSRIGSGSPLTNQECLQESWEQVRKDAEIMELCNNVYS